MKKVSFKLFVIIISISVAILSCKKEKEEEDNDVSSASENSYAENIANDIAIIGNQVIDNANNSLSTYRNRKSTDNAFFVSCASSVVLDSTNRKITVTFNNTVCADGRIRSGSLIFDYSSSPSGILKYRTPGFKCVVTSSNYKVDGNSINIINKSIENTTAQNFNPQTTNLTWTINSNISITKADGTTLTWVCTRNKTLLNTSDTNVYRGSQFPIVWSSAKVGITGSSSGVTAQGKNYTAVITSQLIRDFTCSPNPAQPHRHPFIQGLLEFTPEGKLTRRINYGTGVCDQIAIVSVGNITRTITLQ